MFVKVVSTWCLDLVRGGDWSRCVLMASAHHVDCLLELPVFARSFTAFHCCQNELKSKCTSSISCFTLCFLFSQRNLDHIVDPVSTSTIISYSCRIEMMNKAVFAVASM